MTAITSIYVLRFNNVVVAITLLHTLINNNSFIGWIFVCLFASFGGGC